MTATRQRLPVHSEAEVVAKLAEYGLESWHLQDGWICRRYATENWLTSLALVNGIGFIAEAAWHHPDLEVTWNSVGVKLQTHSEKGITDLDFALARRIEDIALWKPLPESPFMSNPNKWIKG